MSEQNKEQIKQVIMGFTEMFKGITGNQDLKISDELVEKYGLHELPVWKYEVRNARRYRVCPFCMAEYEYDNSVWHYCPSCGNRLNEGE